MGNNYLTYSPSIEAYVACTRNGQVTYYDISPDITSAKMSRTVDAAATFSITLANKNRKYNGLFSAMDRIAIFATKTEKVRLLTGYITEVDAFTLYAGNFNMSGKCSLYHLQELFWDKQLKASQELFNAYHTEDWKDSGFAQVAVGLMTAVGGWTSDAIRVQSTLPDSVIEWAAGMYAAQKGEIEQANKVVESFNKMLKESGPSFSGGGVDDSSDDFGGIQLSGDEKKASSSQKKIVAVATGGTVTQGVDMCLAWVGDVYQKAGYPFTRWPLAIDVWRNRNSQVSFGKGQTKIPLGACVISTGTGAYNAGHIGIYIGGGKVISWLGSSTGTETVKSFGDWAYGQIDGMKGWVGWVAPKCNVDWK